MESNVAEVIKWIIVSIALAMLFALGVTGYRFNQLSNYQTYVNTQIQEHGGLTDEAIANIEKKSKHYNGWFYVSLENVTQDEKTNDHANKYNSNEFSQKAKTFASNEENKKLVNPYAKNAYGTKIHYKIKTNVPIVGNDPGKYPDGYVVNKNPETPKLTNVRTEVNGVATSQVGKDEIKEESETIFEN